MANRRQELIACREAIGSRVYVSEQLGISVVYLRMIETGAMSPGRELMFKFSKYFGKPLNVLFPDMFGDDRAV